MQSIRSKIIIWLLQHRHLFKFKLKPEVITEKFSVEKFREEIEIASKRMERPIKNVTIDSVKVNTMNGEWIIPDGAYNENVILYIHGGGFISGSCSSHRMHVAKFVKESGIKALVFDYRLAPEHPYPAALEDSVSAYRWLLNQGYCSSNIVVAGESAGGTLTLSLLLTLKSRNEAMPNSAVSISPVTDLSCSAKSFIVNARKDIAPMNSWKIWTEYYISNNDVTDPLLSPIFGDLSGLPPLNLIVGTNEIHLDDVINFASKAEDSGVDVRLDVSEGMVHAFPILAPLFPEAQNALVKICQFINENLDRV